MFVQVTNLNVTSIKLDDAVRVFGVDRISGKLRKDANFSLIPKEVSAAPSSDYVTDLVGKRLTIGRVVVGRSETDESVTVASGNWFNPMPPPSKYQWYVNTDRKKARIGDDIFFYGWVREVSPIGTELVIPQNQGILECRIKDSKDQVVSRNKVELRKSGGFSGNFRIPDSPRYERYCVQLGFAGDSGDWNVTGNAWVEAGDPEVSNGSSISSTIRDATVGDKIVSTATIRDHRKAIPNVPVSWDFSADHADFAPHGWDDFHFGHHRDDWREHSPLMTSALQELKAKTNSQGETSVQYSVDDIQISESVLLTACVHDFYDARANVAVERIVVHPSDLFVGVKVKSKIDQSGINRLFLQLIVTDRDGVAVPGKTVTVRAYSMGRNSRPLTSKPLQVTSEKLPVESVYSVDSLEPVRLVASVVDDKNRTSQTSYQFLDAPAYCDRQPLHAETAQIAPDQSQYAADEKCTFLIRTPFVPAEGVLTLNNKSYKVSLDKPLSTLTVSLDTKMQGVYDALLKVYQVDGSRAESANVLPGLSRETSVVSDVASKAGTVAWPEIVDASLHSKTRHAIGLTQIIVARPVKTARLQILAEPERLVGDRSWVKCSVRVSDHVGRPIPFAEVVLSGKNGEIVNHRETEEARGLLAFQHREFQTLESFSTDGLPEPDTKAIAQRLLLVDKYLTHVPVLTHCAFAEMSEPEEEKDWQYFSGVKTANSEGVVAFDVPISPSLERFSLTAIAADPSGTVFGTAVLNRVHQTPLTVRVWNPLFINGSDKYSIVVDVVNNLAATRQVPIGINLKDGTYKNLTTIHSLPAECHRTILKSADDIPDGASLRVGNQMFSIDKKTCSLPIDKMELIANVSNPLIAAPQKPSAAFTGSFKSGICVRGNLHPIGALAVSANSDLSILALYALRLCDGEPTNTEDRASRIISLSVLKPYARHDLLVSQRIADCLSTTNNLFSMI